MISAPAPHAIPKKKPHRAPDRDPAFFQVCGVTVRYAILSDVHGNLEALQAVLGDLAREGADRILFLGDIVGYGADPKECIALLREKAHAIVAGNHDWAAVKKTDASNFNSAARSAVEWTTAQLSSEETNFLAHLPLQGEEDAFIFVHATPLNPELWSYIFFEYDALQNLKALAQKACFIGHSHIPAVYSLRPTGELSYETALAEVSLQEGGRFLINVGSVGQPRDGNASAAYGLYDDEKGLFFLRRVRYDIGAAQRKILSAGLPPVLAERIGRGW